MGVVKLSTAGILNFQKYSSMRAGIPLPPPKGYDLLESQVLSSSAASVTFSGLSQYAEDYKHLQIRYVGSGFTTYGSYVMAFNGDTTYANYAARNIYSAGAGLAVGIEVAPHIDYQWNGGLASGVIDILDAFETSKNKVSKNLLHNTVTGAGTLMLFSHMWMNTAAINSITFYNIRQNLPATFRMSIYGLGRKK